MANAFSHIELTTDNLKLAEKFYRSVFAWNLKPVPGAPGGYTMIDVGVGTGGGMQARPMPEAPTGWMPYVTVDDVKKTMAKASKLGASVMLAYLDIGQMGAIGVFKDPMGSVIGIWQPKDPPKQAAEKVAKKLAAKPVAKKAPAKKAPAKKKPGKKR